MAIYRKIFKTDEFEPKDFWDHFGKEFENMSTHMLASYEIRLNEEYKDLIYQIDSAELATFEESKVVHMEKEYYKSSENIISHENQNQIIIEESNKDNNRDTDAKSVRS